MCVAVCDCCCLGRSQVPPCCAPCVSSCLGCLGEGRAGAIARRAVRKTAYEHFADICETKKWKVGLGFGEVCVCWGCVWAAPAWWCRKYEACHGRLRKIGAAAVTGRSAMRSVTLRQSASSGAQRTVQTRRVRPTRSEPPQSGHRRTWRSQPGHATPANPTAALHTGTCALSGSAPVRLLNWERRAAARTGAVEEARCLLHQCSSETGLRPVGTGRFHSVAACCNLSCYCAARTVLGTHAAHRGVAAH